MVEIKSRWSLLGSDFEKCRFKALLSTYCKSKLFKIGRTSLHGMFSNIFLYRIWSHYNIDRLSKNKIDEILKIVLIIFFTHLLNLTVGISPMEWNLAHTVEDHSFLQLGLSVTGFHCAISLFELKSQPQRNWNSALNRQWAEFSFCTLLISKAHFRKPHRVPVSEGPVTSHVINGVIKIIFRGSLPKKKN